LGEKAYQRKKADKDKARLARFESETWRSEEELTFRRYSSYEEYLQHQASKLDKISDRLKENEQRTFDEFVQRFSVCSTLPKMRSVLCLGARDGAEVKALLKLGYFAVGVDLNPGENNAFVLPGDFHQLVFADDSIDAIYCNSLDHVFDLGRVVAEIKRVLRPGGIFIAELLAGYEEGFIPGAYEATHWRTVDSMIERIRTLGGFSVAEVRPLGKLWRGEYTQVTFAKEAAADRGAQPEMAPATGPTGQA
jgi:SAM-dependent methyltransferase